MKPTLLIMTTTNRRWLPATGGVVLVLVALASWMHRANRSSLDATLAAHEERARNAAAAIRDAKSAAESAGKQESAYVQTVSIERAHAGAVRVRADSVFAVAQVLDTAFREAYVLRDSEAIALRVLAAAQDSALTWADTRAVSLSTALDISEVRAADAESLLVVVQRNASEQCRIVRVVPCPSRRVIAVLSGAAVWLALKR